MFVADGPFPFGDAVGIACLAMVAVVVVVSTPWGDDAMRNFADACRQTIDHYRDRTRAHPEVYHSAIDDFLERIGPGVESDKAIIHDNVDGGYNQALQDFLDLVDESSMRSIIDPKSGERIWGPTKEGDGFVTLRERSLGDTTSGGYDGPTTLDVDKTGDPKRHKVRYR